MSINPPLSGLCEQRPFAERRGLIHQPQFFALYKETPMAFRIKPAGASGSRVCGMAASLPNEAEFGFWPPRFLKQKPVALFCFFTSPEGQLPRRPAGNCSNRRSALGLLQTRVFTQTRETRLRLGP